MIRPHDVVQPARLSSAPTLSLTRSVASLAEGRHSGIKGPWCLITKLVYETQFIALSVAKSINFPIAFKSVVAFKNAVG